jgi:hypothetical protein
MLYAITFEEIKKMKLLLWIIQRRVTTLMELMMTRKRDGVLEAHTIVLVVTTDLEVDKTRDTPYSYGCFWMLLYTCFCKCFS